MNFNSPENLANKILEETKNSNGKLKFPICPFKLLIDRGVIISLCDFNNLSGVIINDIDNVTIVGIKYRSSYARQRFTAAHELCHYIRDLKSNMGEFNSIECLNNQNTEIEKYADDFASSLLMPRYKIIELCNEFKNKDGFVDFEKITIIAEFFGVSFRSCVNRIAYDLKLIDGDITPKGLNDRINNYKPNQKRRELINETSDEKLLSNMIDSLNFIMIKEYNFTKFKFLQNYIYYDNKLEGVKIKRSDLNFVLSDLNYNQDNSRFFNSEDEGICMTLGNLKLQEFVLNSEIQVGINKCQELHKLLYHYVPFPENNGRFRSNDAIIKRGTIQPVHYYEISEKMKKLDIEFSNFLKTESLLSDSEYIRSIVEFIYEFIVIHPFNDGNGRISRALMNWMLQLRNIPPIYVDETCYNEYYNALSKIDLKDDFTPFIIFVERRILFTLLQINQHLFIDNIDI